MDTEKEVLVLRKSFSYRLGKERKFRLYDKSYPVSELSIDENGQMLCDFTQLCAGIENEIAEEKRQYQLRQDRLKEMNEQALQERERRSLQIQEQKSDPCCGLNPVLLDKCRRMIAEGNGYLVSKKYYEAIMREQNR